VRYGRNALLTGVVLAGFAGAIAAVPASASAARGSTVYVASGAYFTHADPNLLLAKLR
jgi:hypothetical protein